MPKTSRPRFGGTRPACQLGVIRRDRAGLLRTTALQAASVCVLMLPAIARAQIAPNTLPTGGSVVVGNASISQSGNTLQVTQQSNTAAVNWNTFNIGSNAQVKFVDPSAQAVTFNRVTSPDPSIIAGRMTSNGQVVLINQSGVVFTKSAVVDVQSLVATTANITNDNIRAGRMVFDQPGKPGASIVNEGSITVGQTGLAALVAPRVVNNGVIQAKMGHVVLAGAEAATIDLYGDGLLSIDVTKQVSTAPTGADGKPVTSLVVNSGTIVAQGGTVLLTASAVDGLVQDLVTAGGKISANSRGGQQGTVMIAGTGGSVVVEGDISARGNRAGQVGGNVQVTATGNVTVAGTAKIDASGKAGGGTIAVGTTLARAKGGPNVAAPKAANVLVQQGATLAANATQAGTGGNVTLLSAGNTIHQGSIQARGAGAGNGGTAEISGKTLYLDGGAVDLSAAGTGALGTLLFDPADLIIATTGGVTIPSNPFSVTGAATTITPASIAGLNANVTLSADHDIIFQDVLTLTHALTATAGNNLTVNAALSTSGVGALGVITLAAGAGGITLNASVSGATVDLSASGGGVNQTAGALTATTLQSTGGVTGNVTLAQAANSIGTVGNFTVTNGNFTLVDAAALTLNGNLSAGTVDLSGSAGINQTGGSLVATLLQSTGGVTGNLSLSRSVNNIGTVGNVTVTEDAQNHGDFILATANGVTLNGAIVVGANDHVDFSTAGLNQTGGSIAAGALLSAHGFGGDVLLTQTSNAITNLGDLNATGHQFTLVNGGPLSVINTTTGSGIKITTTGTLHGGGTLTATGTVDLKADAGIDLSSGVVNAGTLLSSGGVTGTVNLGNVANNIGTIGDFAVSGGDFILGASNSVALIGAIAVSSANGVYFSTGGLNQTAGSITAGALLSAHGFGGDVLLGQSTNVIQNLGDLNAGGHQFTLANAGDLSVINTVTGNGIKITTSGTLHGGGTLNGAGTVDLNATTGVDLSAGLVNAGTLISSGGVTGDVLLSNAANAIHNIGDFAVTGGNFTLRDAVALVLAGNLSAGTVDLSGGAGIGQSGGGITASVLQSTNGVTGSVSLGASNSVATLGNFAVTGGDFQFADAAALTVAGTVGVDAGHVVSVAADSLSVTGTLNATGGTIALGPNTAQPMTVNAASLAGLTADTLRFGQAVGGTKATTVTLSGNITTGATLDLVATGAVTQSGPGTISAAALGGSSTGATIVNAGNAIPIITGYDAGTGDFLFRTSVGLALAGNVSAATADLSAGGNITQTGGSLTATTLRSSNGAGGTVGLTSVTNSVGTLGAFAVTGGDFLLADATALTISQPVAVDSGRLISIAANSYGFSGTGALSAANGTIELGPLTAGQALSLNAGSLANLTAGTLRFGKSQAGGSVAAASVDISSSITLTGTLEVESAGTVTQSAGVLNLGALGGSANGASFQRAGNAIAKLVDFDAGTGILALTDGSALTVAGHVSGAGVTLSVPTLSLTGTITTAGTASLTASSGISQAGGSLDVGTLTGGTATGNVTLNAATNKVGAIGNFSAGSGNFALTDSRAVTVTGSLGAGSVALTDSATGTAINLASTGSIIASGVTLDATHGGIALAGTLGTAFGTVDLTAAGGIAQNGGAIQLVLGTLKSSGGVTGDVSLTSASNVITSLGAFSVTGGNFLLADSAGLTFTAPVQVGSGHTLSVAANSYGFSGAGALSATGGTIELGPLTAGQALTLNAGSLANLTADTLRFGQAAASGGVKAASLTIDSSITTSATLDVVATGTVTQTGGTLSVAALGGSANGASFMRGGNAIAKLVDFDAGTGALQLSDSVALNVAGTVTGAGATLITTQGMTLSGVINTAGTATLDAGAGITQSGGSLVVGTLASDGVTGDVLLTRPTNQVGAIGDFSTTGNFTLHDAAAVNLSGYVYATGALTVIDSAANTTAITVSGTVPAATLTLNATAGSISLTGAMGGASSTVDLSAAQGISQTGVGYIYVPSGTLKSSFGVTGDVSLTSSSNYVGTLGDFAVTAGNFTLTDVVALNVAGVVSGGTIALTDTAAGAAITVSGALNATLRDVLTATSGSILLTGAVDATNTGTIDLNAVAGVTQSGGSLVAGTLLSSSGVAGGVALASVTNEVGSIGDFAVSSGNFALADARAVDVRGVLSAGSITVTDSAAGTAITLSGQTSGNTRLNATAGDISLTGVVNSTGGTFDVSAAGNVTQTGGSILAAQLISSSGVSGDVSLPQTGNQIGGIGDFNLAGGNFTLVDAQALDITGALSASNVTLTGLAIGQALSIDGAVNATGTAKLTASNGFISLAGTLSATGTGTVDLNAATGVQQFGGTITAGLLKSSAGVAGDTWLLAPANAIGRVGDFAVTGGDFQLADSRAVNVTGVVSAGSIWISDSATGTALTVSGALNANTGDTLIASNGAMLLTGVVNATATGVIDLSAADGVTQSGGSLVAGTLLSGGGVTGDVVLTSATNQVGRVGDFAVTSGNFTLTDARAVDVSGVLSADGITVTDSAAGFAITVSGTAASANTRLNATAGDISLTGVVNSTGGTFDVSAAGDVMQTGGSILAAQLISSGGVGGDVSLPQTGNVIGAIGNFHLTGGDFTLTDSTALDITGALSATNVTLTDTAFGAALTIDGAVNSTNTAKLTATNGSIGLTGTVNATSTGTIDLNAAAGVAQTTGSLVAGTLLSSGGVTGVVALTSATNQVGSVGDFAVSGGGFILTDAHAVNVTGMLSANAITLTDSAAGTAITVSGTAASPDTVLRATAGDILLTGVVNANGGTFDVSASGDVTQTGGSIIAMQLGSTDGVGGNVSLPQAGNQIEAIGNFALTGGDFTLVDAAALNVTGSLSAANVTLTDSSGGLALTIGGSVTSTGTTRLAAPNGQIWLIGAVNANSGTIDLNSGDGVIQTSGSLVAGTLRSGSGVTGSVSLASATNAIGKLDNFAVTAGDFLLTDARALTVNGVVSAGSITLTDSAVGTALTVSGVLDATVRDTLTASNGSILLTGAVDATSTGTIDLNAAAGVTQTTGSITAGTLLSSGGVTGDVALTSATNQLGSVGDFAVTAGGFTLADARAVDVAGVLSAGSIAITDSAAGVAITVSGVLASPDTALHATAGDIGLTGLVNATGGTFDVSAAGDVTQINGSILAASLISTGGVGGNVSLPQPGNQIGAIGNFTLTGGDFTLTDAIALNVSGSLSAANVTLTGLATGTALTISGTIGSTGTTHLVAGNGAIALAGVVDAHGGTIDLDAATGVSQTTGSLVAGTLLSSSGVTGSVSLASATNAIGKLENFAVTGGDFLLTDAQALTVSGVVSAGSITLTDSAAGTAITVAGALDALIRETLTASHGAILLTGAVDATSTGTIDLNAATGVAQTTGSLVAGTLLSSGGVIGDVVLASATNQVGSVGDFAVTAGDFTLTDARAVDVTGVLSAGTITLTDSAVGTAITISGTAISADTVLQATSGDISLTGVVNSTGGTFDVSAIGDVTQTGGSILAANLVSTNGVGGDLSLTQPANAITTVGNAVVGGNFSLKDAAAVTIGGSVSATNILVTDTAGGTAITLAGALNAAQSERLVASAGAILLTGAANATATGTIDLNAASGVNQTGGSLTAGTLLSSDGVTGNVNLAAAANAVGRIGDFAVTAGNFTLTDASAVVAAGTVSAGIITINDTAGGVATTVTGALDASGRVVLNDPSGQILITGVIDAPGGGVVEIQNAAGGVVQTGGSIVAGVLTSTGTIQGGVVLAQAGNAIGILSNFAVQGGDFTLTDAAPLTQLGTLSANTVTLHANATGTALTLAGVVNAANALVLDTPHGGVLQTAGEIVTPLLTGAVGNGDASLGAANGIATLGQFTVSHGNFLLTDAVTLNLAGPVQAAVVGLTDIAPGTAMVLNGNITATSYLSLYAPAGGIAQAGGSVITTPALTGTAAGTVSLAGGGNAIQAVTGMNVANGDFTLLDSIPVTLYGPVAASGNVAVFDSAQGTAITVAGQVVGNNAVMLTAGTGAIESGVTAAQPSILLNAAAAIVTPNLVLTSYNGGVTTAVAEANGAQIIGTGALGGSVSGYAASGNVNLTSGGNRFGQLGAMTVGGDLSLTDAISFTAAGPVLANNITLATTGNSGDVNLTITGSIQTANTTTGVLTVNIDGQIHRTGGQLAVGVLTGIASHVADFGAASLITTLGSFTMIGSVLTIDNAKPLTITGPLTAEYIGISAVGSMTLAGNVTTLGIDLAAQGLAHVQQGVAPSTALNAPGTYFNVKAASDGSAQFTQTGTVYINALNGPIDTVRIQLPSTGGTIYLNNLQAPTTDLVLFSQGGSVTGNMNVNSLTIVGRGGGTDLQGIVGGFTGFNAANVAIITPEPDNNYRFNACPVGSVNCVLLPINGVPPINPLRDLAIGAARNVQDDTDAMIPNVSDEDY